MTRTLPWQTQKPKPGPRSRKSPAPSSRPAKRQWLLDPNSRDGVFCSIAESLPKRIVIAEPKQADRELSSSPIPEPPPQEFMREGLHADDIYMMVEDEFYDIAHSFTKHLHYAEYKRLKNLARVRKASSGTKITRPVDSTTVMRAEIRKKKEQEERSAKTEAAVNKIGTKIRRTSEDDDGEIELVLRDDSWAGTHLHNLMTSPSKTHKSLTGLQGIASNSRAAAGLKQPERKVDRRRQYDLALRDTAKSSPGRTSDTQRAEISASSETEDDDDENDLDAHIAKSYPKLPSSRSTTMTSTHDRSGRTNLARPHDRGKATEHPPRDMHATEKAYHAKSAIKDDHAASKFDMSGSFLQSTPLPSRHTGYKRRVPAKKPDADALKSDVNEIPIFLI